MYGQLEDRPYTTWQLIKAYWQSHEKSFAYFFLISALLLTMCLVGFDVLFTTWYNAFYNALQEYDKIGAIDLLLVFVFLATIAIVFAVYRYYIQTYLGLRWRKWLTQQFVSRWLEHRSYYYLENFEKHTDNPDQRIQEDIGSLVAFSLDLVVGLFGSIATLFAFIVVLWRLSGVITLPLGHLGTLHIPGYLVWVSMLYATIGSFLTFKVGRPLIALNFEQQRREANFRYAAVDLRTHAENIALYNGEDHQKGVLNKLLDSLLSNWYMIILRQKMLLWFTAGYNQVAVLVPIVVALPNYFNKVFKLGGWMQTLSAFNHIQDALSFLVNAYTRIAEWQAVAQRLLTFLNHMHEIDMEAESSNHLQVTKIAQDKIVAQNVSVFTPQNTALLTNVNAELVHGNNYLITGHSGIGKSTFVRLLAGIWPFAAGKVELPQQKNIMYLPQRSYMPIGTLREALLFPDTTSSLTDEQLSTALRECNLPHLTGQLHEAKTWVDSLSPGEVQRIAFVRVLLQKPDWVFLDESTSMLDLVNEKHLYEMLRSKLPNCSVVSVGHRPSLAAYHPHEIDMAAYAAAPVVA